MSELKCEIDGINIFEHEYDKWKGHEECNGLISEGVAYRFHKFLIDRDLIADVLDYIDDTYNNLSGARDGNRYDIHDHYRFTWDDTYENLEISFLYVVNGNLWGVIYDKANDSWFGEFEIPRV